MIRRTLNVFFNHAKSVEAILIGLTLWWSFLLILPTGEASFSTYHLMTQLMIREVWSGIFFVVAVLTFYGMIQEHKRIRIAAQIVSAGLWLFVAAMFGVSGDPFLCGTYFCVFLVQVTVLYRVGESNGC